MLYTDDQVGVGMRLSLPTWFRADDLRYVRIPEIEARGFQLAGSPYMAFRGMWEIAAIRLAAERARRRIGGSKEKEQRLFEHRGAPACDFENDGEDGGKSDADGEESPFPDRDRDDQTSDG